MYIFIIFVSFVADKLYSDIRDVSQGSHTVFQTLGSQGIHFTF